MGNPSLLIRGGTLVDPSQGVDAPRDVLLENGRVEAILRPGQKPPPDARVLDAAGCWVIPGIIDLHVHLREPGREEAETIETGTRSAAKGGVCTVLAMPNTLPPTDSPEKVRWVYARARERASVNVLVAGAVTLGQAGRALTRMEALAAAGAAAFSDDGLPVADAGLMRAALKRAKRLGLPVLDHAEDLELTGRGVMHEGAASRRKRLPGIPAFSEALMSARDIRLAEETGAPLHLCHVSCAAVVDMVRDAKRRGVRVTAEAAPHHFSLTDEDIPDADPNYKMKPPLRAARDRAAVIEGLADGTLDVIATDHAPHPAGEKARGMCGAPFGIVGLETLIPLSLELVRRRALSRRALAERLSTSPARILGLRAKGTLRRGADADVTLIDPAARTILRAPLASKSANTPFLGRALRGAARATIVGGRVAYRSKEAQ